MLEVGKRWRCATKTPSRTSVATCGSLLIQHTQVEQFGVSVQIMHIQNAQSFLDYKLLLQYYIYTQYLCTMLLSPSA